MNTIEILHKDSAYQTIRPHIDTVQNTHWCFMHAPSVHQGECYRPCFNTQLMRDMHAFLRRTASHIKATPSERLSHVVLASDADVFNLGGDLNLFANHIRQGNRESLLAYAKECIEGVHTINSNLHSNAHTVALVQGDALGGGFELALSCTTVIAEIGVQMGFPEVLFGLFPGMGAYTLISRKTSHKVADDLMSNGLVYRSEELYEMGLVDILAEKGEGVAVANEFIRKNKRIAPTRCALNRIRSEFNKIDYSELLKVAEIWVDCAMNLSERSLKTMERLVAAQNRRVRKFNPHYKEIALMAG